MPWDTCIGLLWIIMSGKKDIAPEAKFGLFRIDRDGNDGTATTTARFH